MDELQESLTGFIRAGKLDKSSRMMFQEIINAYTALAIEVKELQSILGGKNGTD